MTREERILYNPPMPRRAKALLWASIFLAAVGCTAVVFSAEPLPTAGELGDALAIVPANTPVRLPSGAVAGLEKLGGTLVIVPADNPVPPSAPHWPTVNFALQPGADDPNAKVALPPKGSRLIDEAELRYEGLGGLTIRVRPQWIYNNATGQWNLTFIDECVARCERTGDLFTILLMGGAKDPLNENNLRWYEAAANKLAERYERHPLFAGPHITGASPEGHSEEQFWGKPMPSNAMTANKRMIRAWSDAFPRHIKLYAGSANDPAAMRELQKYGIAYTGGKFLYKNNAASAKMDLDWAGNTLIEDCIKAGGAGGWEALDNSSAQRFGGTLQQAFDKQDVVERRAGLTPRRTYRAWYPGDLSKLKGIK